MCVIIRAYARHRTTPTVPDPRAQPTGSLANGGVLLLRRIGLALGMVIAIIFSINAKFFGKYLSKINRDKCLKIWGSKIYLVINAQTPGHEHATPKDVGTSAILAIFWGVRLLWFSRLRNS